MTELRKVARVITKRLPDAPHETLLVLDGTAALATCLSREHVCRTITLVEAATPRVREHLQRAGVGF